MMDSIPNLWPKDINVKIVSPRAILRAQVAPLEKSTQGLLSVEVITRPLDASDEVIHELDIVARPLSNLRIGILNVVHNKKNVYPARFEGFYVDDLGMVKDPETEPLSASSETEFMKLLGEILGSRSIRALIESLLIQINDTGLAFASKS